jgi:putative glutamine amidotransferase
MKQPSRSGAPLIGITADLLDIPAKGAKSAQEPTLFLPQRYCHAVQLSGGIPLILPPVASDSGVRTILHRLDGLLISGGDFDIHPRYYGEKPIPTLGAIKQERTEFELALVDMALKQDLPLLGICGGVQALNVALGGSLYQDIMTQLPNAAQHQLAEKKHRGGHAVKIKPGTRLRQIVQRKTVEVNTTHHQALKKVGKGLVVNATASDGLIEGVESPNHSFVLGVQWHPEVLAPKDLCQRKIFSSFIAFSRRLRRGL